MQKLDGSGVTVMSVDYDPFGNIIDGTLVGEYGFSTKPLIADLDWYYYGFRYYDPVTGRWPSRDPIGEQGGFNLYGMVGNDPVNWIDYLGLNAAVDSAGGKLLRSKMGPIYEAAKNWLKDKYLPDWAKTLTPPTCDDVGEVTGTSYDKDVDGTTIKGSLTVYENEVATVLGFPVWTSRKALFKGNVEAPTVAKFSLTPKWMCCCKGEKAKLSAVEAKLNSIEIEPTYELMRLSTKSSFKYEGKKIELTSWQPSFSYDLKVSTCSH